MGASDIYMRFYVGDYLADTGDLSTEEHGAYLLLLLNMWRQGGELDASPDRLRRLARVEASAWPALWDAIGRFFEQREGKITQKRLAAEYERAVGLSEAQAKRGRSGGLARASRGQALAKPPLSQISESESEEDLSRPAGAPAIPGAGATHGWQVVQEQSEPAGDAGTPKLWSGEDWRVRFAKAWSSAHSDAHYGRGAGDAKASSNLSLMLSALPMGDRVGAQLRAGLIFAEFLADMSPKAVEERHQFSYFVIRFNSIRLPAKAAARAGPARDARHGHARAEDSRHTHSGEVKL